MQPQIDVVAGTHFASGDIRLAKPHGACFEDYCGNDLMIIPEGFICGVVVMAEKLAR